MKEKTIPTIFGLLVLIGGIFISVVFVNRRLIFGSKASSDCRPTNPQITNITHQSLDISFSTSGVCQSSLSIDNRTFNSAKSSKLHYFSVYSLKENTTYSFSFINNGEKFTSQNYTIKTGLAPKGKIPSSNLAWGKILSTDKDTSSVIYLNIPGGSPLSALVTSNGNWNIPLSTSFNENRTDWFTPPSDTEETIIVISSNDIVTQIVNKTSQNNPVPDIIVGQDRLQESVSLVSSLSTSGINQEAIVTSVPSVKLSLDNPKEDEVVYTLTPEFFGKAQSGAEIIVKLGSITSQSTVGTNGSWRWVASQNLSPGPQTLTISSQNPNSKLWESVSRRFFVMAKDTSTIAFTASSSALKSTSTPTPTLLPSPTSLPTLTPTITPKPVVRVIRPTLSPDTPVTGNSLPTISIVVISVLLLTISLIIFKNSPNL